MFFRGASKRAAIVNIMQAKGNTSLGPPEVDPTIGHNEKNTSENWHDNLKHKHLKMYLLLKMVIFQCHVRFQGDNAVIFWY